MKVDALVVEIGSTTTVVNVFDHLSTEPAFLGQGLAATTIQDVRMGLQDAIDDFHRKTHLEIEPITTLASSSAAGGLKMSVHGLVYDMTVKAAREAALGAGANILMTTAGILTPQDLERMQSLNLNIIMIAGGVDYGESKTSLENARLVAQLDLSIPVIFAGNCVNRELVRTIFEEANQASFLHITENVYPKIDEINIEGVRSVIHHVFEEHIIHAPGMNQIRTMVNGAIMPTPGAVYQACLLLQERLGDLVCCDVGGATTDVVSIGTGKQGDTSISITPEPFAKRTVEGDLGVYINRMNLVESIGKEKLAKECEVSLSELDVLLIQYKPIPPHNQIRLTRCLTYEALRIAIKRHVGTIRDAYTANGKQKLIEGKDTTDFQHVIGTGGALTRLPNTKELIQAYLNSRDIKSLKPSPQANIWLDHDYIFASLGVLSTLYPQASVELMLKSIGWKE